MDLTAQLFVVIAHGGVEPFDGGLAEPLGVHQERQVREQGRR
jgi:hypothetical protein